MKESKSGYPSYFRDGRKKLGIRLERSQVSFAFFGEGYSAGCFLFKEDGLKLWEIGSRFLLFRALFKTRSAYEDVDSRLLIIKFVGV